VHDTNHAARALYAATGFVELARRRRYYRDGSDAVVLELTWKEPHD
jgi:ribosomal-protein-alanine N-acetyltransferase